MKREWEQMAKKVEADNLTDEITKLLTKYSSAITDECKKVVDECTEGVMREVKNHITFKNKKYVQAFRTKTSFEDKRNKRNTWYVEKPYYRLTHLLEFDHVTNYKTGKYGKQRRTNKFPHVKFGEEYLKDNFFKKMEEAIEKCRI